ncbi:MAG: PKD domain-containing protein [Flavobacteriales bacterium]|nr:PKD domain-containing protein [Flavobacteriales bacterium]
MRTYSNNKMKFLIGLFSLAFIFGSYQSNAQCHPNIDCNNAILINTTWLLQTHDCVCANPSSESWFVVDIGTTDQFFNLSGTDGTQTLRLEYEAYGPFTGAVNCAGAVPGNLFDSGANFTEYISGGTMGYSITSNSQLSLVVDGSGFATYYLVKVVDVDDSDACLTIKTRLTTLPLPVAISMVTTASSTLVSGVANTGCSGAVAVACDYDYTYTCAGPASTGLSNSFLYYVLDITNPGDQVDIDILESGVPQNFSYILVDQTITDPCASISSTNYLDAQTNVSSFSHTFITAGQYILVLYDLPACPEITMDRTPDCNVGNPCPPYAGELGPTAGPMICDLALNLCDDYHDTIDCLCPLVENKFWYTFDVLSGGQTITVDVEGPGGSSQLFDWGIAGPLPVGYTCSGAGLTPYLVLDQDNVISGTYVATIPGQYIMVIETSSDCPVINFDFLHNCNTIPCPTIEIVNCGLGGQNLIVNGDFEFGNQPETTTLITSDLIYQSNNTMNPGEGSYIIDQAPIGLIPPVFHDHTPGLGGSGYVMFVHDDLANLSDIAWEKTLSALTTNTDYHFEAWFTPTANEMLTGTDNDNLIIDGVIVASVNRVGLTPGMWFKIEADWNSTTNTSAVFQIEIKNVAGADDGRILLDDISVLEFECTLCTNEALDFTVATGGSLAGASIQWNFGDGSAVSASGAHTYASPGMYTIKLIVVFADGCADTVTAVITIEDCDPPPCESCIGSFAPIPGGKYLIGAWAKEEGAVPTKTAYTFPKLYIDFGISVSGGGGTVTVGPFAPEGIIIDGWQRIESEFDVPGDAINMAIRLTSTGGNVFYDDIRVLPYNGSMKTYVYDPVNMRLSAELDERHYATFYEYDEEGKLKGIKKETEKGVMTIQTTINNSSK